VYAAKEIIKSSLATDAANYIAPDWLMSHYIVLREKFTPAMRPFVKNL